MSLVPKITKYFLLGDVTVAVRSHPELEGGGTLGHHLLLLTPGTFVLIPQMADYRVQ